MKKVIACVLMSLLFGCGGGGQQTSSSIDQSVISACGSVAKTVDASVSVTPTDSGIYTIQGNNMDGVAGIDLTISYDGSLSSPTVTQGSLISGSMMAANTINPGRIKIAVISTKSFSGSGPLAKITFADGSGSVKIVSVNMINSSGASVTGSTSVGQPPATTPGIPFSQPNSTPQATSITSSPGVHFYVDANGLAHACP